MPMNDEKKRKSCYQRHAKAPYVYSETLRQWEKAAKKGDDAAAEHYAAIHAKQFGYTRRVVSYATIE